MINSLETLMQRIESQNLVFNNASCNEMMPYSGRIKDVKMILSEALRKKDDMKLFLYTTRLLMGIVDYGLATKKAKTTEDKRDVERFCNLVYRGEYGFAENILANIKLDADTLNAPVVEKPDNISWHAFNPTLTKKIIEKMEYTQFSPDYVVIDGHDGNRPGFMLAGEFNASAISIRNSQDSKRDKKASPLCGEEEGFQSLFRGKKVLVFGEDVSTGRAIRSIYELILRHSLPKEIKTGTSILFPDGYSWNRPIDFYAEKRNTFS